MVTDAEAHPTHRDNPLVTAGTIGAYAGHPLVHDGQVVGTVSVRHPQARTFTAAELALLQETARMAAAVLDLRQLARCDALTGLPDRAHAIVLGEELLRWVPTGGAPALPRQGDPARRPRPAVVRALRAG